MHDIVVLKSFFILTIHIVLTQNYENHYLGGGSIPWGSFGDVEDGGRSYCERDEEESEMGESAGEEDVEQSDVIDKEPEEDGVE